MNNKFWLLIAGIVSAAVLLMGWFLGISPKLDEMSAAEMQRASVEAQNVIFQNDIDTLEAESKDQDKIKEQLSAVQLALPPGGDLATFLGQLHQLEGQSGVLLQTFSATSGEPFIAVENGTGVSVSPLVTQDNFIVITVNLSVTGTRDQVLAFLHALQFGDRLFLINSLTVQSGSEDLYTGDITGYVYVLVDPSAPPPIVTPVAPIEPIPTDTPAP